MYHRFFLNSCIIITEKNTKIGSVVNFMLLSQWVLEVVYWRFCTKWTPRKLKVLHVTLFSFHDSITIEIQSIIHKDQCQGLDGKVLS